MILKSKLMFNLCDKIVIKISRKMLNKIFLIFFVLRFNLWNFNLKKSKKIFIEKKFLF